MNCHYCGTALQGNEPFCRHCGTRQQHAQPQAPIAPVMMPETKEVPISHSPMVYKEKTFDWQPYGAPAKEEPLVTFQEAATEESPVLQLPVKRKLWKMIVFGILTLGIYPTVIWSRLTTEVNLVASRYDGERSMPFFAMLTLAPLTLGIHSLVWIHKLCRRIGAQLQRRFIDYPFGARDFWIWAFLMSILSGICFGVCAALAASGFDVLIILWVLLVVGIFTLVGPFVFTAKLMRAMNRLNEDYNTNG